MSKKRKNDVGVVRNTARALIGQGVGMGWGDEGEAWLRSRLPGGKSYKQELANIQKDYAQYARKHNVLAPVAEFTGGVLPTVAAVIGTGATGGTAAPAAVASGARTLGALGRIARNPYVRGAVTGAVTGAVSGAGSAQPGSRSQGAATGAIIGTGIGGAAPVVLRGGRAGSQWLRSRLAPTEKGVNQQAAQKVNRALQQQGMTPQQAAQKLAEDRAMGVPSTLANTGRRTTALGEVLAQRPGSAPEIIEEALEGQRLGARERVYGQTRQAISPGDFYGEEAKLVESLRRQADTLYDKAYEIGSVSDGRIQDVLQHPRFQGFYNKAREIAETEAMTARLRGEDPNRFKLSEIYTVDSNGVARLTQVPDVRTLDYIKRGIDATIDEGFRGGGMSPVEANALKDLRKVFVNTIDEATGGKDSPYLKARQVYAGDMEVLDAMRKGMDDFNKLDHEEIIKLVKDMTPTEKEAFRTGAVRNLYSRIMSPTQNINAAQRVIGAPEMQAKLQPLFDSPAKFDLFKAALERESQLFQQSNQMLNNSATFRRLAANAELQGDQDTGAFVGDLISSGGFLNSLTMAAARLARSAQMSDEVAGKTAKLLMSSDPADVAAAVRLLEDEAARAVPRELAFNAAELGVITGATAAFPSAPTDESQEPANIEQDTLKESESPRMSGPDIEADLRAMSKNVPGKEMSSGESSGGPKDSFTLYVDDVPYEGPRSATEKKPQIEMDIEELGM
jgi:hypothetical protein